MNAEGTSVAFDLGDFLARERGRVEEALLRATRWLEDELPTGVATPAAEAVRAPGKRLRPILCVAGYRAAGGGDGGEAVYDLAAAVELIHAYSLMHDDLPCMDDAELRRGRPATHRIHGEEATMVAGAALIPGAALRAWRSALDLGVGEEGARRIVGELTVAAGGAGMVGGQVLDLVAEGTALDAGELDALHGRKTGALLAASPTMGALAAGASEPTPGALRAYGRRIGLAFQIVDDILDATASTEELGKVAARDAELEKATYVSLHGVEEARRRAARESEAAREELRRAGVESPALAALARFVVERKR